MNVGSWSRNSITFGTTKHVGGNYLLGQLTEQYSGSLRIKSGNFLGNYTFPQISGGSKTNVLISEAFLDTAGKEPAMIDVLQSNLEKIGNIGQSIREVMGKLRPDVELSVFTINRSGQLTCVGKEKADGIEREFKIDLGNIKESNIDYGNKLYEYFGISKTAIIFASA